MKSPYPTVAEAAVAYAARGWKPVPINRKSKKPIGKAWQKQPYCPSQFNGSAQNVAVQLGGASAGLVDVDLDSITAIGLAPQFLPDTGAIFGRAAKPASHQLYFTDDLHRTEKAVVIQFKDAAGGVIVELRTGGGDKGAVTTMPPS